MGSGKIGVIGAGPGGLACAMILAHRGFDVTVFEKENQIGGRNAPIKIGDFQFDTGPTFLNMKFVLDDVFNLCERSSSDYIKFKQIDPMYLLSFAGKDVEISSNRDEMRKQIQSIFPSDVEGLDRFFRIEKKRYEKILPNLRRHFSSFLSFLSPDAIKALPYVFARGSIYDNLSRYFSEDQLRICFTFQSKYLGMSPWECPAAFTMISYIEHEFGIYHTIGGLNSIAQAMAKVVLEEGGRVETGQRVQELDISGSRVNGIKLENGKTESFDEVVVNSDFAYSVTNLVPEGKLRKYSPKNIAKKKFSCSTFMLYLGLDKKYSDPHHHIVFADDYKSNISDIGDGRLSEDFSFYVQNASITDDTLAPSGKSAVYILVPVPNNFSNIDWEEEKMNFRHKVLACVEKRTGMEDLTNHIEVEKMITPIDWDNAYNVYKGATFNLAHNIGQMLYFRPHNKFEELDRCYLVGGGTHPGSGLPTIYLSSIISAGLISKKYKGKQVSSS